MHIFNSAGKALQRKFAGVGRKKLKIMLPVRKSVAINSPVLSSFNFGTLAGCLHSWLD